jgi:hypothetical protein
MPYISPDLRQPLDPVIDQLALQIVQAAQAMGYDGAFAGMLNYTCTRLALNVYGNTKGDHLEQKRQ